MTNEIEYKKNEISKELEEDVEEASEKADEMGLDGRRDVKYWVIDQDEMTEAIAYQGFQKRYHHWRWGMNFDRQQKQREHLGGKAYEIVINDSPCHAYLQMSNNMTDQKSVIAHVEGHSDFFSHNEWFQDDVESSEMLARHADRIDEFYNDPSIDSTEVEKWIDHILCIEDNIDQHSRDTVFDPDDPTEKDDISLALDIDEDIEEFVFRKEGEEEEPSPKTIEETYMNGTVSDVLGFLMENGRRYNEDTGRAEEFEDWQQEILEMLREDAYYFAPQKMTQIMNEGWATYVESMIMTWEGMADVDDIIEYADQTSKVLRSGQQLNPYSLGLALWKHIENSVNRREVVDKLLRINGVTVDNFKSVIDFSEINQLLLDGRDESDIIERNYSLTRPENTGFIKRIPSDEIERCGRYIMEDERYDSVEEAIDDVDYHRGWERMKAIRETHNDTMFIDEFLTQEFVDDQQFYTYEYRAAHERMEIASRDVDDVRKKLLVERTNFGKPTIEVASDNFDNSGELLLVHRYNGISINMKKAHEVLERLFEMWGRPVNLATVQKSVSKREMKRAKRKEIEPEPTEEGVRLRYDGEEHTQNDLADVIFQEIKMDTVEYNTKLDEWYDD